MYLSGLLLLLNELFEIFDLLRSSFGLKTPKSFRISNRSNKTFLLLKGDDLLKCHFNISIFHIKEAAFRQLFDPMYIALFLEKWNFKFDPN